MMGGSAAKSRTYLLAADAPVLLDPLEGVIHQATEASHVVRVAVHKFLPKRKEKRIRSSIVIPYANEQPAGVASKIRKGFLNEKRCV